MSRQKIHLSVLYRIAWPCIKSASIWLFVCALIVVVRGSAAAAPTEYQVKAAFLYNFAKFVDWPTAGSRNETETVAICIMGDDDLAKELDEIAKGATAGDRTIAVRRIKNVEGGGCQILFLGKSVDDRFRTIIAGLKAGPVLTVGDADNFLRVGGMIKFFIEDRKIRFEVNLDAVEKSPVRVSSKLLKLAKAVHEGRSE